MQIQEIPRIAWLVLSLVIGSATAFSVLQSADDQLAGQELPAMSTRRMNFLGLTLINQGRQQRFEREAVGVNRRDGEPLMREIRVLPPQQVGENTVTFVMWQRLNRRSNEYEPYWFEAPYPYVPFEVLRARADEDADPADTQVAEMSVYDWLKSQERNDGSPVPVTYLWHRDPGYVWPVALGSSVVLLGLIVPTGISLASGNGLWGKPREKRVKLDPYDKPEESVESVARRFGGSGSADADATKSAERVDVDAEVEARIASAASAPPLEALPEQTAPTDEPKDYKGEFYPVARDGKKKGED